MKIPRIVPRTNWIKSSFAARALVVFLVLILSGQANNTLAGTNPQCKPDNILNSGFETTPALLFEDTFEGCRSPLWQESNGDWQVAAGAYYTSTFST